MYVRLQREERRRPRPSRVHHYVPGGDAPGVDLHVRIPSEELVLEKPAPAGLWDVRGTAELPAGPGLGHGRCTVKALSGRQDLHSMEKFLRHQGIRRREVGLAYRREVGLAGPASGVHTAAVLGIHEGAPLLLSIAIEMHAPGKGKCSRPEIATTTPRMAYYATIFCPAAAR